MYISPYDTRTITQLQARLEQLQTSYKSMHPLSATNDKLYIKREIEQLRHQIAYKGMQAQTDRK